ANPEVFSLKQGKRLTVGRDKGNDIVLPEVAASRKHAEVFPGQDGFYVRDLGSSNGVIVNSTRIDNPYLLVHGDRFTIGSIMIYFLDVGASSMVGEAGHTVPWTASIKGPLLATPSPSPLQFIRP